jgi:hypothetical protein
VDTFVGEQRFTIGRSADCDVVVADDTEHGQTCIISKACVSDLGPDWACKEPKWR